MSSSEINRPGPIPPPNGSLPAPFIPVPSLANLRDVGSIKSQPHIRSKILYRAADPSNVSLSGIAQLHDDCQINTIFDLRSEPEIENSGTIEEWTSRISEYNQTTKDSTPVTRYWTPVFKAEDYGPSAVAMRFRNYGDVDFVKGFVLAYEAILEHGAPVYGRIIKHLADPGTGGGTLVHCTAGKDRTGVIVAVVLALVGVSDEAIADEYQLTEIGLSERRPHLIERLAATGAFGEGEEARAAAERMTGSRKESMLGTLKFLREKYGSVEAYAKDYCGVSDADLKKLRTRLVVQEAGGNAAGSNQASL